MTKSQTILNSPDRPFDVGLTPVGYVIKERLAECARALRAVPHADSRFRARIHAVWPEHDRTSDDLWFAQGIIRETQIDLIKPTAAQVTRMDDTLEWYAWVAPQALRRDNRPIRIASDVSMIMWWRSCHLSWNKIKKRRDSNIALSRPLPGGNSHVSLRRTYRLGISVMEEHLLARNHKIELPDSMR